MNHEQQDQPVTYRFTLDLTIFNQRQLHALALKRAIEEGMGVEDAQAALREDGEISISRCLHMVLDPGTLSGCAILESVAEPL